jgi:hypothetical protein
MAELTFADPDRAERTGRALGFVNKPAWIFQTEQ